MTFEGIGRPKVDPITGLEVIESPDVDPLSTAVSAINQEIIRLESERFGLKDPDNSDRIDEINQRIIMLQIKRDGLLQQGAR